MVCLAGEAEDGWVALLHHGHHPCWWLVVWGDGAEAVVVPDMGWKLLRGVEMRRQLSPAPTALRGCRVGSVGLEGILDHSHRTVLLPQVSSSSPGSSTSSEL